MRLFPAGAPAGITDAHASSPRTCPADWSLNCLLNESAAGIHLDAGNGLTGMHFDFLATEAALDVG
ncbi:hypothetical protein UK23_21685 [Lentzea aerocolonigenes]|uniref:Crocagin biosynthetic protein CgnE/B domain-containing protein n=1 Tax=Lentzea aerocolonigenes TaxID=68170 RepID=A0A0F0GWN9_LENAE|nr:hypothetical protein [Lentzea aerocolonigenes]KJK46971.1 hypothetical protein UK23_21685 [Lentzea aerocolonigenes]